MRRLRTFLHLSWVERSLLVKSLLLLTALRVALQCLSFSRLLRSVRRVQQRQPRLAAPQRLPVERVTWAVAAAARNLPGSTCLAQALTAQVLLGRRGHQPELRIGVSRSEQGILEAHAWVEVGGQTVIGGLTDLARFTPLKTLDEDSATLLTCRPEASG